LLDDLKAEEIIPHASFPQQTPVIPATAVIASRVESKSDLKVDPNRLSNDFNISKNDIKSEQQVSS
jgi:hypothetical protein